MSLVLEVAYHYTWDKPLTTHFKNQQNHDLLPTSLISLPTTFTLFYKLHPSTPGPVLILILGCFLSLDCSSCRSAQDWHLPFLQVLLRWHPFQGGGPDRTRSSSTHHSCHTSWFSQSIYCSLESYYLFTYSCLICLLHWLVHSMTECVCYLLQGPQHLGQYAAQGSHPLCICWKKCRKEGRTGRKREKEGRGEGGRPVHDAVTGRL